MADAMRRRDTPTAKVGRVAAGVVSVIVGLVVVVGTAALGSCDAFGGTCPASPGLHGDVYAGIASGLALMIAGPVLAWQPDRRGVVMAASVGIPVVAFVTYVLGRAALT